MTTKKQQSHESNKQQKILITAALPYANGSIHLGHMVEYIQADIYTRVLKLMGKHAVFVCADDTHGAPIEIKASQLKLKPEQLIEKYYQEHTKDFADFGIQFDSYYSTNSSENKKHSNFIFHKLKEAGYIYKKTIAVIYCNSCKRFLPDRYVKGTCPKCKAPDQYGDVCEKCSSTHKTTDLINPKCSICGNKPVEKQSEHYFFKLSVFDEKLKHFFQTAQLQPEIVNFVSNWLPELQDWCISRDGPYFGFKIPGEENKYYYVWLDAPVGYISSTENYCNKEERKETVSDYWNNPETRIVHFIGKDIVYFHFLFWPAMLMTAGFQLPKQIMVHGFLTVNKEKMSKSRGTFITARQYLDAQLNPEFLRFYYAAHLSPTLTDLDLDLQQFKEKINSELIGNIANFCYRVLSFVEKQFGGKLGKYHETAVADEIVELQRLFVSAKENYENINFKDALKDILAVSSIGNKYFQSNEPWKLIKEDRKKTEEVLAFCTAIIENLSILLTPILPIFAANLQKQLGKSNLTWHDLGFAEKASHHIHSPVPLLAKLENEHEKLIVTKDGKEIGKEKKEAKQKVDHKESKQQNHETKAATGARPEHEYPLLLKVGKILDVQDHPNAEKLYVETIDLGEEKRTIVSGIKQCYKKEDLVGKHVIVVANLKPVKLRGIMSEGMILAAEYERNLKVLEASKSKPGDLVYREVSGKEKSEEEKSKNQKIESTPKQIQYEDFEKCSLTVEKHHVLADGKKLKTIHEEIKVNMPDGIKVK